MKSSFYITGYLRNQENIFKLSRGNKKDLGFNPNSTVVWICKMRQPLATSVFTSVTRGFIVKRLRKWMNSDTRLLRFEAQWLCILNNCRYTYLSSLHRCLITYCTANFTRDAIRKYQESSWLKQQKFIFL